MLISRSSSSGMTTRISSAVGSPLSVRSVGNGVYSSTVAAISVANLQYTDCLDVVEYDTPLKAHLHVDRFDFS